MNEMERWAKINEARALWYRHHAAVWLFCSGHLSINDDRFFRYMEILVSRRNKELEALKLDWATSGGR